MVGSSGGLEFCKTPGPATASTPSIVGPSLDDPAFIEGTFTSPETDVVTFEATVGCPYNISFVLGPENGRNPPFAQVRKDPVLMFLLISKNDSHHSCTSLRKQIMPTGLGHCWKCEIAQPMRVQRGLLSSIGCLYS
jgi:hypothetical protein